MPQKMATPPRRRPLWAARSAFGGLHGCPIPERDLSSSVSPTELLHTSPAFLASSRGAFVETIKRKAALDELVFAGFAFIRRLCPGWATPAPWVDNSTIESPHADGSTRPSWLAGWMLRTA